MEGATGQAVSNDTGSVYKHSTTPDGFTLTAERHPLPPSVTEAPPGSVVEAVCVMTPDSSRPDRMLSATVTRTIYGSPMHGRDSFGPYMFFTGAAAAAMSRSQWETFKRLADRAWSGWEEHFAAR